MSYVKGVFGLKSLASLCMLGVEKICCLPLNSWERWNGSNFEEADGSMESAKVLVHTDLMHFNNEDHFLLIIGDKEYEVFVREIERSIRPVPCFFCVDQISMEHAFLKQQFSAMEAKESHSN